MEGFQAKSGKRWNGKMRGARELEGREFWGKLESREEAGCKIVNQN